MKLSLRATFLCYLVLLVGGASFNSFGQPLLKPLNDIPVKRGNKTLQFPWAGGLNNPQFSMADLNQDGIQDLFIFDRSAEHAITFKNYGIKDSLSYEYAPQLTKYFPSMVEWALLRDFNCDGVTDIMTSDPGSIRYFEGAYNSDSLLTFTDRDTLIFNGFSGPINIYAARNGIPAIVDVNGDGDLDVLSFPNLGGTLKYYENQSMETQGNCAGEDIFVQADDCWGLFFENASSSAELIDSCDNYFLPNPNDPAVHQKQRHSGSALMAFDYNGDGAQDLVLGNISFNNLILLTNGGTSDSAKIVSQDTTFPSYDKPVDLPTFPASFHVDVDNDGLKDLLVGPNQRGSESRSIASSWFYKNTGSTTNKRFSFQTDSFLVGEMIDLGTGAHPAVVDYNQDSLPDLVVGNFGYFDSSGISIPSLTLFENTGTPNEPEFTLITRDFAGLRQYFPPITRSLHPTFGDLDNDGDQDMVIGESEGGLHYFENTAAPGNPMNLTSSPALLSNMNVGSNSAPFLFDVDSDGDLDLVVGERNGNLNYFENEGSPSSPSFNSQPNNNFFGKVDTRDPQSFSGFSSPIITRLDSSEQLYLLSGNKNGHIFLYKFLQDSINGGAFPEITSYYSNIKVGRRANISVGDLNNDDSTELLVGNWRGGIELFGQTGKKDTITSSTAGPTEKDEQNAFSLYPNPAANNVTIRLQERQFRNAHLKIFNLMGRLVYEEELSNRQSTLRVSLNNWTSGIYLVTLQSETTTKSEKLLVTDQAKE